jgi:hypothetical protein
MPENAGFYHAAYVVAAVVYLGYAAALLRRRGRVRAAPEREHRSSGAETPPPDVGPWMPR